MCLFENNLIPGNLKHEMLNMEHFVQRQSGDSGDSFCDQLRHPISKQNSSIQNGSISIGRSYSNIAFLGLRKGGPALNHSFVPKNGGTNLGEEPGKPKPSISARTPLCKCYGFCSLVKVMAFVLIKGVSPSGISIHP